MRLLCAAMIAAIAPCAGMAQSPVSQDPLPQSTGAGSSVAPPSAAAPAEVLPAVAAMSAGEKFTLHWNNTVSPLALAGVLGYAGLLQEMNSPREWKQGWGAYGLRAGSSLGASVIHSGLALGLDSALHQDPRYFPGKKGGWLKRTGHAIRGTVLTRTDRGTETFSTWRVGSAYGSAFLSNLWYPKRLDTFELGIAQGSITLGFDLIKNLANEFWPDLKRKVAPPK